MYDFDSALGLFHYLVCPNDDYILNSLERLSFAECLYRLLRERGFDRVIFYTLNQAHYTVLTFDRLAYESYIRPVDFENIGASGQALDMTRDSEAIDAFIRSADQSRETASQGPAGLNNPIQRARQSPTAPAALYGRFLSKMVVDELLNELTMRLIPAINSRKVKTAIVFPVEMLADHLLKSANEYDTRNNEPLLREESRLLRGLRETAGNNIIIFHAGGAGFRRQFLVTLRAIECDERLGETQIEDYVKSRLYISTALERDELLNLILRNIIIEQKPGYSDMPFHKLNGLAKKLYRHFTKEKIFGFTQGYDEYAPIRSISRQLDNCTVIREINALLPSIKPKHLIPNTIGLDIIRMGAESNQKEEIMELNSDEIYAALREAIIGQDESLRTVAETVCEHFQQVNPQEPEVLLLLGPSGVGKSETFKVLAAVLKSAGLDIEAAITVPLNEYGSEYDVNKLKGASPGFIGYGNPTPLDELADNTYNLVVFDEMEKAHEAVWQYLMEILDKGEFISVHKNNRKIPCKRTVFAFTSNLVIDYESYRGISDPSEKTRYLNDQIFITLQKEYNVKEGLARPFIGRIHHKLHYNPINDMALGDKIRITAHCLIDIFKKNEMRLGYIEPRFLAEIYWPVIKQSDTGVRAMYDQADRMTLDTIKAHKKLLKNETVLLGGHLNAMSITRSDRNDIDACINETEYLLKNQRPPRLKIDKERIVKNIQARIIGQDQNIEAVCGAVVRHICAYNPTNPEVIFLLGSTGVGKTETFHLLSEELSKLGINIGYPPIEVALSEFAREGSEANLAGADPGYIGYGTKTKLDKLNDNEYNLVLFNEMDKAHPSVWKYLMEIIEQGVYNSKYYNRKIQCKKAVFAFTSNLAVNEAVYHALPESQKNAYLTTGIIQAMMNLQHVSQSVAEPIAGRFTLRLLYNSISFMSVENKLDIAVNAVVKCFAQRGMKIVSMEPCLIAMFYERLLTNTATGIRGINNDAKQLLTGAIEKYEDEFYDRNIRVSGTISEITAQEWPEDEMESCVTMARQILTNTLQHEGAEKEKQNDEFIPIERNSLAIGYENKPSAGYNETQTNAFYRSFEDALLFINTDKGEGTAFLITDTGYALTCGHVVEGASEITTRLRIKGRQGGSDSAHRCAVLKSVPGLDIALLRLEGSDFPYMSLAGPDRPIDRDEPFVLVGYPFGGSTKGDYTSFQGVVASSSNQRDEYSERYFIDSAAKCGNSGSPVISKRDGRVIGILIGSVTNKSGELVEEINYMRPIKCFWDQFTE